MEDDAVWDNIHYPDQHATAQTLPNIRCGADKVERHLGQCNWFFLMNSKFVYKQNKELEKRGDWCQPH